jgi:hypothetical protein
VEVDAAVGFAGDGGADDVDDGEDFVAASAGFAEAGQGIGGFAGLADDEDEGAVVDGRVAVAEFAGVFDFDGDVGEFLDEVFAGERGVPAGAAGGDHDAFDGAEFGVGHVEAAELGGDFLEIEPAADGIFEGARLLEDFLEHVMREVPSSTASGLNSSALIS